MFFFFQDWMIQNHLLPQVTTSGVYYVYFMIHSSSVKILWAKVLFENWLAHLITLVASHFIIQCYTCYWKIVLITWNEWSCFFFLLGFRYANYFVKNNTLHRTLFKAYGIRFLIMVYGEVGDYWHFNFKLSWSYIIFQFYFQLIFVVM